MAYAIKTQQISVSNIQRRFDIGYARSARIVDDLEERGFIEHAMGSCRPHAILMTAEHYKQVFGHDIDNV